MLISSKSKSKQTTTPPTHNKFCLHFEKFHRWLQITVALLNPSPQAPRLPRLSPPLDYSSNAGHAQMGVFFWQRRAKFPPKKVNN